MSQQTSNAQIELELVLEKAEQNQNADVSLAPDENAKRKRGRPKKIENADLAERDNEKTIGAANLQTASGRRNRQHATPPEGKLIPRLSSTTRFVQTQNGRLKIVGERYEVREKTVRLGKDEMNLVEHPFALLWKQEDPLSIIHFEWTATHPITSREVEASWTVTGDPRYGLPNASDERLYLVLMELTREAGFESSQVHFSRYDVLTRLGWSPNDRSYSMLLNGLTRLAATTIHAFNSFYNPRSKSFINGTFHLLEESWLDNEPLGRKGQSRQLPLSWFRWSRTMFESFQSGYLRSLDLDFALALRGDIALRLFRYLDKKAFGDRATFEIELTKLCVGHLGMKPTPYPSKLKERLKGAHDELLERGFLASVEFEPMKSDPKEQKVRYTFGTQGIRAPEEIAREAQRAQERGQGGSVLLAPGQIEQQTPQAEPFQGRTFEGTIQSPPQPLDAPQDTLLARILEIGVSENIARQLLRDFSHGGIEKQLDCLNDRKPKSRAATFVKSVRELWALPDEYLKRIEGQEREQMRRVEWEQAEAEKTRQKAAEREEKARLEQEGAHLDAMWEKLDETTRSRIDAEVDGKLGILGHNGRGDAARIAFRRAALRDLLALANS